MSPERIPSFGFARGAVVRATGGGPNMLVVRGLGETTAVILCEGDEGGTLRLREYQTADLEQLLPSQQHQAMIVLPAWPRDNRGPSV